MNVIKLANKLRRTLLNLASRNVPMTSDQAQEILAQCWEDVKSDCYLERPDWPQGSLDVSIILPTYNDAAHICRGLDSVLSQETDYTFEVIVINDGSTDDTRELLQKYESLPNVTVLHQENRGHSGARNAGLDICQGRYILFHDSDDTLLPGALQALLACATEYDADVVAGGYLDETPDGIRTPALHFAAGQADANDIPGMTCGKLYRRSLFTHLQFPDRYWYEDSIVSQIILPSAACIRTIDWEVFAYLQNEAGVSSLSQGRPKSLDSLYITEKLLQEKAKFGLPLDAAAYRHFLHMVLLTYHRTAQLSSEVRCALFQAQRKLKTTYFPGQNFGTPLEKSLITNNYRSYLWQCETDWILGRFRGTLH